MPNANGYLTFGYLDEAKAEAWGKTSWGGSYGK